MNYLSILLGVVFSVSNLNAQTFQVKKDILRTNFLEKCDKGEQFAISPWGDWVLHAKQYDFDSTVISMFPASDSSNEYYLTTFHASNPDLFGVNIKSTGGWSIDLSTSAWDLFQNNIYIIVKGSTLNKVENNFECFTIDVSKYCAVKIPVEFTNITRLQKKIAPFTEAKQITASPNPFSKESIIEFLLPEKRNVSLNIYDVSGCLIKVLGQKEFQSGKNSVKWDGTDCKGRRLAAGSYYCQLISGDLIESKHLIILK